MSTGLRSHKQTPTRTFASHTIILSKQTHMLSGSCNKQRDVLLSANTNTEVGSVCERRRGARRVLHLPACDVRDESQASTEPHFPLRSCLFIPQLGKPPSCDRAAKYGQRFSEEDFPSGTGELNQQMEIWQTIVFLGTRIYNLNIEMYIKTL